MNFDENFTTDKLVIDVKIELVDKYNTRYILECFRKDTFSEDYNYYRIKFGNGAVLDTVYEE